MTLIEKVVTVIFITLVFPIVIILSLGLYFLITYVN